MSEIHDLATLIRAGTALITIETSEETRVVETFRHVWSLLMRPLWRWTLTDGLVVAELRELAVTRTVPAD